MCTLGIRLESSEPLASSTRAPPSQGVVSIDTETHGTPRLAEGKYADATAFLAVDHEEKNNGYATFCGQSVRSCH